MIVIILAEAEARSVPCSACQLRPGRGYAKSRPGATGCTGHWASGGLENSEPFPYISGQCPAGTIKDTAAGTSSGTKDNTGGRLAAVFAHRAHGSLPVPGTERPGRGVFRGWGVGVGSHSAGCGPPRAAGLNEGCNHID